MNAAIPEGADLPSLDDPQEVNYLLYSHALAAAIDFQRRRASSIPSGSDDADKRRLHF